MTFKTTSFLSNKLKVSYMIKSGKIHRMLLAMKIKAVSREGL